MERDLCRYKEYTEKTIALYNRILKELNINAEVDREYAQMLLSDFVGTMGMSEAYKFIDLSVNQNEDKFKTFLLCYTGKIVNEEGKEVLIIFGKETNYLKGE